MTQNYGSTESSRTISNERESKDGMEEKSNFRRGLPQFCVVGVKNLILLGWGLILGYPTVLLPGLQNDKNNNSTTYFELNEEAMSWIASINLLCVPLGSLTSGLLMDPIGKRRLMQILNIPMLAAWALFYFATDITQVYIGLCLSGMSGGLLEAPLLIYIAETVEPKYRGMLTASGTATVLGGVCLQFIIGTVLHWRTVAIVSAVIPFLAFNAVFLVPESPYWLYKKNRIEDARKSLQWLRGWVSFDNVKTEFEQITYSVEELVAEKKARAIEGLKFSNRLIPFTKRSFIAPFTLILFGFISGHFSGMTPLQTYAIQILGSYHVPINEYYATILLGAAQVLGCIIGMIFVRSIGKRRLVFVSMAGCGACFMIVGTHSYMSGNRLQSFTPVEISSSSPSQSPLASQHLQASIENFEENVLNAMAAFRDKIDDEAIKKYGEKIFDLNTSNAKRLAEIIEMSQQLFDSNAVELFTPEMFSEFLSKERELIDKDSVIFVKFLNETLFDPTFLQNLTTEKILSANFDFFKNVDPAELVELFIMTREIVQMTIPEDIDEETILSLVEKVDMELRDIITSNRESFDELGVTKDLNDLSTILASLAKNLTVSAVPIANANVMANTTSPSHQQEKSEEVEEHSWLPLILLLGGSLFAHMGTKLFPWMLIGEVYPMEIRNGAAGISSAFGYLIGFLSNKLFLDMVAIFTLNGTFWFYSAVAALGCIILYFVLPETENKTLQEIEAFFDKKKRTNFDMKATTRNNTISNDTDITQIVL